MLDTQRKLAVVTGASTEIGLRQRMPEESIRSGRRCK
jgi:hypothetical protein